MSRAKSTSTDLTPVPFGTDGEFIEVKTWVTALPMADSDDEATDRILARILAKTDIADILTPESAEGLRDHVGEQLVIHDARWRPSTVNKGLGAFLILDVELSATGRRAVMTTGAGNVMAAIVAAYNADALPFACKVTEVASQSDPSRKIQYLVAAEAF